VTARHDHTIFRQHNSSSAGNLIQSANLICKAMTAVESSDHYSRFFASALSSGLAEIATLPTDVVKVRLQIQQDLQARRYKGFIDCVSRIVAEESIFALWKGFIPALVRQVLYSSMSLVIYEPVIHLLASGGKKSNGDVKAESSFCHRFMAGGISGVIGIICFNWTEVIKTQMQTSIETKSMSTVFRQILKTEGVSGFFAGLKPNILRTFLVNATQLSVYDQIKFTIFGPIYGIDSPMSHLGSSGLAGVATAITSTPADVVKTRLMNDAGENYRGSLGVAPPHAPYRGFIKSTVRIYKEEGVLALYKGFWPICVRRTVWCTVFFLSYEKIRTTLRVDSAARTG
jgi:hypothetical protein